MKRIVSFLVVVLSVVALASSASAGYAYGHIMYGYHSVSSDWAVFYIYDQNGSYQDYFTITNPSAGGAPQLAYRTNFDALLNPSVEEAEHYGYWWTDSLNELRGFYFTAW